MGADPGALPALSLRAWDCAAAYGLDRAAVVARTGLLFDPPPKVGKLSALFKLGADTTRALRCDDAEMGGMYGLGLPIPNDGKLSLVISGAFVTGMDDEYDTVEMG